MSTPPHHALSPTNPPTPSNLLPASHPGSERSFWSLESAGGGRTLLPWRSSPTNAEFYARAAAAWLLSACLAAVILRGWICGQGFRARTFHLALLFYSTWLARDALKLHLLHGTLPESRRCRGPGLAAGALALGERVLMGKAWLRALLWIAAVCFLAGLAAGGAVWGKRMPAPATPPRPTLGAPARRGLGGVGGTLVEILLFVTCVLSCVHGLPVMVIDYMAATANCGVAAAA